jgi:hypothetical protein
MESILEDIIGIVLFYGLEIVAVLILIGSALFARLRVVVIICGIIAAGLMAGEWFLWWVLAAMDHAQLSADTNLKVVSAISVLSLLIYFPVAIARLKAHRKLGGRPHHASPPPMP